MLSLSSILVMGGPTRVIFRYGGRQSHVVDMSVVALDLGPDHRRYSSVLFDSRSVGWWSVRLEMLEISAHVEHVALPGVDAQMIDLQVDGVRDVQSRHGSRWSTGSMRPGSLALKSPHASSLLHWESPAGDAVVRELRLLIPRSTMARAADELWGREPSSLPVPSRIGFDDDVLRSMLVQLERAARAGVSDLYAASAAEFAAVHLLTRHGTAPAPPKALFSDARISQVVEILHSRLDVTPDLGELAAVAGLSRFHLLRLFRQKTGETPSAYHRRLRLEQAQRLLRTTSLSVTEIGHRCGYPDPSHFGKSFRRLTGSSPVAYRRQV
ncbi:AraC family transcriptional regulator [Pseudonocardia nematodicida]|uniref:AraC family transcriptional regulator n=1 Tax=Pseudonocardia nematodicida TaxID=1206997 RepID=A0ABV1KHW1_9PSEU